MELIKLTHDNLDQEHICCAISNNRDVQVLEEMAKARNAVFQSVHIRTREDAQSAPSPFTTFSLFYDGQLVTHEILSEKKFDKVLAEKGW